MTEELAFKLLEINKKKALVFALLIGILILTVVVRLPNYITDQDAEDTPQVLLGADPYWHYRHAQEILKYGHPGQEVRDGVPHDLLHDAPEGERVWHEFWYYFIAYSFKFPGQFLTNGLMQWCIYLPVIFSILAVFMMFMLVREHFGAGAGLASAFLFSLSVTFLGRGMAGFCDTDMPIIFFMLLTFFFFGKMWRIEA